MSFSAIGPRSCERQSRDWLDEPHQLANAFAKVSDETLETNLQIASGLSSETIEILLRLEREPLIFSQWQRIFTLAFQHGCLEGWDNIAFSGLRPDRLKISEGDLNRIEQIAKAGKEHLACFLDLARSEFPQYYTNAEFSKIIDLYAQFCELTANRLPPVRGAFRPYDISEGELDLKVEMLRKHASGPIGISRNSFGESIQRGSLQTEQTAQCRSGSQSPSPNEAIEDLLQKFPHSAAFNASEKLALMGWFAKQPFGNSSSSRAWLDALRKFRSQRGSWALSLILQSPMESFGGSENAGLNALAKLSNCALVEDKMLRAWLQTHGFKPSVLPQFSELAIRDHTQKPSKSDLSETLSRFREQPAPLPELDDIEREYREVVHLGRQMRSVGKGLRCRQFALIRERSHGAYANEREGHLVLAIGQEALREHFGIIPYSTQMLALLGLIRHNPLEQPIRKGRIAQVLTGEGKSTIIALVALYLSAQRLCVDIVSSSQYLAKRDREKYREFFAEFGVTSAHICSHGPLKSDLSSQIVYGTNTDFEFAWMRHQLFENRNRVYRRDGNWMDRPLDVAIVDEVDNLLIDTALNSARIAISSGNSCDWIFERLLNLVKAYPREASNYLDGIEPSIQQRKEFDELFQQLQATTDQLRLEHESTDERMRGYVRSALKALKERQLNRHYVIRPHGAHCDPALGDEIVIVDAENTGRLAQGSRWSRGIHELLEAKHALAVRPQISTIAGISHPLYFKKYQTLLGLTGTLGDQTERAEICSTYAVDTVEVPPHRKCARREMEIRVLPDETSHLNALIAEIETVQRANRPILLLFPTIEASSEFAKKLISHAHTRRLRRNDPNVDFRKSQILDDLQKGDEEQIIAKAGEAGQITIATNTAGRGTDICLTPESKRHGGLHVVYTFYPESERVERQGLGRAARQGEAGSSCLILQLKRHEGDRKDPSLETYLERLRQRRNITQRRQSKGRLDNAQVEIWRHGYLEQFYADLATWHDQLDVNFFEQLQHVDFSSPAECAEIDWRALPHVSLYANQLANCLHLLEKGAPQAKTCWLTFCQNLCSAVLKDLKGAWSERFFDPVSERFSGQISANASIREAIDRHYQLSWAPLRQMVLQNPKKGFRACLKSLNKRLQTHTHFATREAS